MPVLSAGDKLRLAYMCKTVANNNKYMLRNATNEEGNRGIRDKEYGIRNEEIRRMMDRNKG